MLASGAFYLAGVRDSEPATVGFTYCREQYVPPQVPEGAGPWMAQSAIPPSNSHQSLNLAGVRDSEPATVGL